MNREAFILAKSVKELGEVIQKYDIKNVNEMYVKNCPTYCINGKIDENVCEILLKGEV